MELVLQILSWLAIIAGSGFLIIGAIGIVRFPDFFTRLHPAGITDTLGAALILLGLILQAGLTLTAFKLFLIFLFLMITSPVASFATARAALAGGLKPLLMNRGADRTGKAAGKKGGKVK